MSGVHVAARQDVARAESLRYVRPRDAMPAGASSIAATPDGSRFEVNTHSGGCSRSALHCRLFAHG